MDYSDDDSDPEERRDRSAVCHIKTCTSPWMRITNLEGHTFYRHVPTGETTWEFPTNNRSQQHKTLEAHHFIDSEWQMYEDEYGSTYYYNQQNKESKWRIPCTLPETTQTGQSDREELTQWKQKMTGAGWGPWLKSKTSSVLGAVGGMSTVVRRLSTFAYRKASDAVSGWVSSTTDDEDYSGRESRWRDTESPLMIDRRRKNTHASHKIASRPPPHSSRESRISAMSSGARPPLHSSMMAPAPRQTDTAELKSNMALRPLVLPWAPPAADQQVADYVSTPVRSARHTSAAYLHADTYSSSVHSATDSDRLETGNWSSTAAEEV